MAYFLVDATLFLPLDLTTLNELTHIWKRDFSYMILLDSARGRISNNVPWIGFYSKDKGDAMFAKHF